MAKREECADSDRTSSITHELSGGVVNGCDMVCIDCMTKPKTVSDNNQPDNVL
jgi:hypothetical protein